MERHSRRRYGSREVIIAVLNRRHDVRVCWCSRCHSARNSCDDSRVRADVWSAETLEVGDCFADVGAGAAGGGDAVNDLLRVGR